ncbi:hypothetical protein HanRHA438_Chr09g0405861 [Helianthus annuus]|nr:hypothetical protein HanRHA438_Chr09g0405861 [Helianthus annuus]
MNVFNLFFVVVCGSAIFFLFKKMEVFKFLFYGFVVLLLIASIFCVKFVSDLVQEGE